MSNAHPNTYSLGGRSASKGTLRTTGKAKIATNTSALPTSGSTRCSGDESCKYHLDPRRPTHVMLTAITTRIHRMIKSRGHIPTPNPVKMTSLKRINTKRPTNISGQETATTRPETRRDPANEPPHSPHMPLTETAPGSATRTKGTSETIAHKINHSGPCDAIPPFSNPKEPQTKKPTPAAST